MLTGLWIKDAIEDINIKRAERESKPRVTIICNFGKGITRTYSLVDDVAQYFLHGRKIEIKICHPDDGEVFVVKFPD
jgi:hypothetical protein